MAGRRGAAPAQAMVEFAIVAAVLLPLLVAIFAFGVNALERASLDYAISTAGYELPTDWGSEPADEVLESVVTQSPAIDPDRLEVSGASITLSPSSSVSAEAGGAGASETRVQVTVSGTIEYKLFSTSPAPGSATYVREFSRSFLMERRQEVS